MGKPVIQTRQNLMHTTQIIILTQTSDTSREGLVIPGITRIPIRGHINMTHTAMVLTLILQEGHLNTKLKTDKMYAQIKLSLTHTA